MPATANKPRILAVDDSRVMRVAMKKILGKEYDVIEAEHGEDAWTLLINDNTIQVLFTDLSMPYLDGYGLLDRMRRSDDPRLQHMPVIIITGKEDDDKAKEQALERGASDFISKPFESVQLIARAKAFVTLKETSTRLVNVEEKLERQAAVDETTGLGGQRYFCRAADEALSFIRRHGGQYVLVRMDIDNFNKLFIKIGKQATDVILQQLGQYLLKQVRKEDMLARVGLSKFAMLLRDAPLVQAEQLAERIRTGIAALDIKINNKPYKLRVSLGLFEPRLDREDDIKAQMSVAEAYLQQAIDAGGNQVLSFSELAQTSSETVNLETALAHIQHNETEALHNQLPALVKRVIPLLDFLAKQLGGDVATLIEVLKEKLKS